MNETTATFAELIKSGVISVTDGYRAKNSELGGDGLIFLRAGHVRDTHIDFAGVEWFHEKLTPKLQDKTSRVGNVIVTTKGNSTGRTSFVDGTMAVFVYSPHLSRWRVEDRTKIDPAFLRYWSRSPQFVNQMRGLAASTDMAPYAWRPFQLIHPAIYVELTNLITEPTAWTHIQARFADFGKSAKIRCLSIPVASLTKRKDQAAQILSWWQGIEQASIDLALDYNHVYHADITDCYGSIYTHSVVWAMHTKAIAKTTAGKKDKTLIGNVIDWRLQDMQQGQTNGVPQGSVLVDLIAEMVLGFSDLELTDRLTKIGITEFQILRYRDDYRIFVNSPQIGEQILKQLTEVLLELGLKLNASKTTSAQAVIPNSIKLDKKQWMRSRQDDPSLQKHLLLLHCHSTDFPNAGSLLAALDDFYQRLGHDSSAHNVMQLVSITVDIGFHSPRCFPVCAGILSLLLSRLATKKDKLAALDRVRKKLTQLPNNGHLEVWQQRLSYHFDPVISYSENLCQPVEGKNVDLWSNKWITDAALRAALDPKKIVNRSNLKSLKPVMRRVEFSLFFPYW